MGRKSALSEALFAMSQAIFDTQVQINEYARNADSLDAIEQTKMQGLKQDRNELQEIHDSIKSFMDNHA